MYRTAVLGFLLLSVRVGTAHGQSDSAAWKGWVFGRLGGASTAPSPVFTSGGGVLISASGGIATSRGMIVGMIRASDSEQFWSGPGVRDNALLIGLRSREDHLFVTGTVGVARATPNEHGDSGTSTGNTQTALAYDFSAHAAYELAGLALGVSGVVGPQRTSYIAVTLGAELGWFGR